MLLQEYLGSQTFYEPKDRHETYARTAKMTAELRRRRMAVKNSIDCLIAQTEIDNDLYLLHSDSDFERISKVSPLKVWDCEAPAADLDNLGNIDNIVFSFYHSYQRNKPGKGRISPWP